MIRRNPWGPALTCAVLLAVGQAVAAPKSWDAGSGDWNISGNWSPSGVPTSADTVTIGDLPVAANATVDFIPVSGDWANISSLTIQNGADLVIDDYELIVETATVLNNSGSTTSRLVIRPFTNNNGLDGDNFDTNTLTVNSGARVSMEGGICEVDNGLFGVNTGGSVAGWGTIELVDVVGSPTTLFSLSGATLTAQGTPDGVLLITPPPARTLQITATDANARLDLDNGASPTISILRNQTLDLDVAHHAGDDYSGTMYLSANATLDWAHAWAMDTGDIVVNSGAGGSVLFPALPATIAGAPVTMTGTGASITLDQADEALVFDADLDADLGTISNSGLIRFNGNTNIDTAVDFQMNGSAASLEVGPGATVVINDTNFNWDGGGFLTNQTTIHGILTINADNIDADDKFDGTIHLYEGDLTVDVADGEWIMDGQMIFHGPGANADVLGSDVMSVTGLIHAIDGSSEISTPMHVDGGTIDIDLGAEIELISPGHRIEAGANLSAIDGILDIQSSADVVFNGPTVGGTGTLQVGGTAVINADTQWTIAVVDLDGATENGTTTLNTTFDLTITGHINDEVNGTVNVYSNTLTVTQGWSLGNTGLLRINNNGFGTPIVAGGELEARNAATIEVGGGGNATISAPLTLREGSLLNVVTGGQSLLLSGLLTLDGGDIDDVVPTGVTPSGGIVVTGMSAVTVGVFDWDASTTTVQSTGDLTLDVSSIEALPDNTYDGLLTMAGGNVTVHTIAGNWDMDGTLAMSNPGGDIPRLGGDLINIGDGAGTSDANVNVTGTGESRIDAPVIFNADADVDIAGGAELNLTQAVTFNGGEYTGDGMLDPGTVNVVNQTTVIGAPSTYTLTLDLDEANAPAGVAEWQINAPLTLWVESIDNVAGDIYDSDEIEINGNAFLNVHLPAAKAWETSTAVLFDFNAPSAPWVNLYGSDLQFRGTAMIDGKSVWAARVDLESSAVVTTEDADASVNFTGGTLADPNRIRGATINGPGTLAASVDDALVGFGTIDTARLNFDSNAELRADDGTLVVNATVDDFGLLGTADADGVIQVNTNLTIDGADGDVVEMLGGEYTGTGWLRNLGGTLRGHGLFTNGSGANEVDNGGLINAVGGTLEFANHLNIDGNPFGSSIDDGDGTVSAIDGDVLVSGLIVDNQTVGTVNVGAGRSFRYESGGLNDRLHFADAAQDSDGTGDYGRLNMNGGLIEADELRFGGRVATAGPDATVRAGAIIFDALGDNTLNGDLLLDGDSLIEAGADFSGSAQLVNLLGSTMTLETGATVGVGIENRGDLEIGASPGIAKILDYVQGVSGSLNIDLAGLTPGPGPGGHDQLVVTDDVALKGGLDVDVLLPFTLHFGQSFQIIDVGGARAGMFAGLGETGLVGTFGGVQLRITYLEGDGNDVALFTSVPGDADLDGDVDGDDFNAWGGNYPTKTGATLAQGDFDGDGDVDGDDFNIWGASFPFPAPEGAEPIVASDVPEPAGFVLIALGAVALLRRRA